ncbi:hypothetical protein FQZ97_919150 [compost metagenome]
MSGREHRVDTLDVVGGFTNDFQIADDGVLNQLAGDEPWEIDADNVPLDARHGLQDMANVVRDAPGLVHTGTACLSTACLKLAGRPLGVNTSTGTPSSFSSST